MYATCFPIRKVGSCEGAPASGYKAAHIAAFREAFCHNLHTQSEAAENTADQETLLSLFIAFEAQSDWHSTGISKALEFALPTKCSAIANGSVLQQKKAT